MVSRADITVPNFITIMRIVGAVAAAFMFMNEIREDLAAFLCIGASILDYFDGWYARKFNQKTRLGAHLDPFADKVLISIVFIVLAFELKSGWFTLCVSVILARELTITIYRMFIRKRYRRYIHASLLGKVKTAAQCVVGDILLFYIFVRSGDPASHSTIIFIAMVLTLFITVDSGLRYLLPSCSDGKKRSVIERVYQWIHGVCTSKV
ncbi:MAG: CDP-diacylglycerol--glycerol-3-phosphate 3-phosphatidyltransferase [Candidatus Latescibacteria bacterium]|nr:CDP-diacylglycerol--glycerol-3-phosphate 3-phosphatidyltransferase [bacterium]MBD3424395.1 CDP-diacylglycerol--glycerol-3-phosphate 3-phosphatidyltransferase [Candidatus Latescibacterota bacterium]